MATKTAIWRQEAHHGRLVRCPVERPAHIDTMFMQAAARAPDVTAVVDGELRLTYSDLADKVAACAGRMYHLGAAKGDRVALLLGNRIDFVVVMLAAARLGLISVPLNIRQSGAEIAFALSDSGSVLLFTEAELADRVGEFPVETCRETVLIDDTRHAWDGGQAPIVEAAGVHEDETCCIVYTSGTTGKPKGAMLTHLGVVTNCMGTRDALQLTDGEVIVMPVPASHVTGLILLILLSVQVAGKLVIQRQFKAAAFLDLAQRERMTFTVMVPAMYKLCLIEPDFADRDLKSWRIGGFGGAPMSKAIIEALAQSAPSVRLANIYGATETTSPAVIMPPEQISGRLSQLGRPLPYCDVRVMDEEGREQPTGQSGEIWVSGPCVIPAYWNRPEANLSEFVGGYWRSGDIGEMDADGYLSISDRKKDMINRGGFKIYSIEVENVLMQQEGVVEAAVVGRPCSVLGERVEAFVSAVKPVDPLAMRTACARLLSDYKVPDHVTVLSEPLPRNANGKLLKQELRDRALALFGEGVAKERA